MNEKQIIKNLVAEVIANHRSKIKRDPLSVFESRDQRLCAIEEEDKQNKTADDSARLKEGNITSDDIVKKLNSIRAGRSFKDDEIKSQLDKYVDDLSVAEKTALFAYLKGIEQIVSGVVQADDAEEPSNPDPSVKMRKSNAAGSHTKVIKPTIIHKQSSSGGSNKSKENTTPPLPVNVKA